MPYYFGEADPGWEEYQERAEAEELVRGPPECFSYIVPWQSNAVTVSFPRVPPPHAYPVVKQQDAAAKPAEAAARPDVPRRNWLARLFGRRPVEEPEPWPQSPPATEEKRVEIGSEEWFAQYEQEQKRDAQEALLRVAVAAEALRLHGVRKVFIDYDGGNDEGFTHFRALEMADGRVLQSTDRERLEALRAAEAAVYGPLVNGEAFDRYEFVEFLDEAVVVLLGRGFGTGPFEMYGAVTVDCEACTITDEKDVMARGGDDDAGK